MNMVKMAAGFSLRLDKDSDVTEATQVLVKQGLGEMQTKSVLL